MTYKVGNTCIQNTNTKINFFFIQIYVSLKVILLLYFVQLYFTWASTKNIYICLSKYLQKCVNLLRVPSLIPNGPVGDIFLSFTGRRKLPKNKTFYNDTVNNYEIFLSGNKNRMQKTKKQKIFFSSPEFLLFFFL